MKKFALALAIALTFGVALVPLFAAGEFHIGIVTGTVSQGEDVLRGAEKLISLYGNAQQGGMIRHITYPDNFSSEMETVISQIVGLADDPLLKAIVVVEAVEHHIEHGLTPRDAAIKAMDEVSAPIVAVGLVLCAVFIPCAFISGIVGQFFRQFAMTIAISTVISASPSMI